MKTKHLSVIACGLALAMSSSAAFAASDKAKLVERMQDAQAVVTQIMAAPDKGIPSSILAGATCVTVVVVKSTAVSDAGLSKQTIYEAARETMNRQTYDRAVESLDSVNREIEGLVRQAWGRAVA